MKGTTKLCVEVHVERVQGEPGGYALLRLMKATNKAYYNIYVYERNA